MASLRLLRPLAVGLTASAVLAAPLLARPSSLRVYCDSSAGSSPVSARDWSFSHDNARNTTRGKRKSGINPRIWRQFLESRGIHIVPYNRIQKYFKGIDVRSALQDNVAFKLSLGTTFTLAAFAEF
ncbi:uncharacterized protein LTHEOB_269 [Neofusicoccum parvum]|uniref:Uncharacterized protein LTHEOB_269 n=1 Tax=Neofusicoccum parvum TaxID=310453 RepID=A0ACB5S8B8_9PEZI|nr:uncharacterized protein LTHEOB_269 [Neofusicoccum parvum]